MNERIQDRAAGHTTFRQSGGMSAPEHKISIRSPAEAAAGVAGAGFPGYP